MLRIAQHCRAQALVVLRSGRIKRRGPPWLWPAKQRESVLQRLHAREPKARGSRIGAAKLVGQRRDGLAMAVRLSGRSGLGNSLTSEGKRHIEVGRCGSADDVRADSQPVRGQVGVADPSLQIP